MAVIARETRGCIRATLAKYDDLWVALAYRFDRNTDDRREFETTDGLKAAQRFADLLDPDSRHWKGA